MRATFYSLKELADLYGISRQTLKKRLEPFVEEINTIGIDEEEQPIVLQDTRIKYSPLQVQLIFTKLGNPTKDL